VKRALPYRTPIDRVQSEEWVSLDGKSGLVGATPLAWDYHSQVRLSRAVSIDVDGVREDCLLDVDDGLRLCVRYWSANSRVRTVASLVNVGTAFTPGQNLMVEIDGSLLGGSLTVETILELANDREGGQPFSPRWAGTMLWRDVVRVPLEGDGGLLPVAPVSFSSTPRLPAAAAWYVSLDFSDLTAAAMGSLLVLVNTDLPVVKRALSWVDGDPSADVLWGALSADIVSDIVGRALDDDDFEPETEWTALDQEALTVGGLVSALVRSYLQRPNETPVDAVKRLRELRRDDPSMYTAEVQGGVRIAGEAIL
jgi:hypothetical protein